MFYFQSKNPNLGKVWSAFPRLEMLIYFTFLCNILQTFGISYDHLVHFAFCWYIFSGFGIVFQEKSGNPDSLAKKCIRSAETRKVPIAANLAGKIDHHYALNLRRRRKKRKTFFFFFRKVTQEKMGGKGRIDGTVHSNSLSNLFKRKQSQVCPGPESGPI
jgi:hypothetical protein